MSRTHPEAVRLQVLLVDDDPDMADFGRLILRDAGFDVHIARNGHDALAALQASPYDLILLDLMMPGMDGLTFLVEWRRRPELPQGTRVLCLSAAPPKMLAEARRLGATACLEKPIDFELLCDLVTEHGSAA